MPDNPSSDECHTFGVSDGNVREKTNHGGFIRGGA